MKLKKAVSILSTIALTFGLLAGCGNSEQNTDVPGDTAQTDAAVSEAADTEDAADITTLEYWTWFPSQEQAQEAITAFESEHPDIKINMTVMESKTFREKVSLALSTGEDIDVIGVQPSAFAGEVQDYLADLEPLMEKAAGADWKSTYSQAAYEQANKLTDGATKMLTLVNSGSMIGFYNVDLLKEIGCEVPTTLEEYKAVADALKEKYPDKYAGVFAGKEAWICDEMMLTVLGQQGDTYNKWRYEGAEVNSPEYIEAIEGLQRYFDAGIFTMDIMDLDYASATEAFTSGDALVYYMGSWEAPLLSPALREKNGIALANVGAMALPVAQEGAKPAVRGYLDCCIGIVDSSSKKDAAAEFVAYMAAGEGANILGNQLMGPSAKTDAQLADTVFASQEEKDGWKLICDMIAGASADRNNVSGYSDIEGAQVQNVINGTSTAQQAAEAMQTEWSSGKY